MPKLFMPVPEVEESATRPVVLGIVRDLIELTGIPADTTISYPGDLEKVKQPGSANQQEAGVNSMSFGNKLSIVVEEQYEMERLLSTAVYYPENLFIFRDDRIETSVKPVYSSADMSINFKYRTNDKVAAIRWRDTIRARVAMMWDMRQHIAEYHYLIPPEFLVILQELHRMREAVDGYGETFEHWFKTNSTNNLTQLTTLAGTHASYGIVEKQLRIVGMFDFDGVPEAGSKEDEGDTWTISFSYKFKYDKPIGCAMFYPLMVHNQLVDQKFRPNPLVDIPDVAENTPHNCPLSVSAFSAFEKTNNPVSTMPGIAIPSFDEFFPNSVPTNTVRVFTALVDIDPTDPALLLSLKKLGSISIKPVVLDFLIGEVPFMFKDGGSIFTLNLYRNHDLLDKTHLSIDTNLDIRATVPLSLRNYYHIRFGLNVDLTLIQQSALDRLRNNAAAAIAILSALDQSLVTNGLLPNMLGNSNLNYITRVDMMNAINVMNKQIIAKGNRQQGYQMFTVESLVIKSFLKNN